jgi:hypothetical protein
MCEPPDQTRLALHALFRPIAAPRHVDRTFAPSPLLFLFKFFDGHGLSGPAPSKKTAHDEVGPAGRSDAPH